LEKFLEKSKIFGEQKNIIKRVKDLLRRKLTFLMTSSLSKMTMKTMKKRTRRNEQKREQLQATL